MSAILLIYLRRISSYRPETITIRKNGKFYVGNHCSGTWNFEIFVPGVEKPAKMGHFFMPNRRLPNFDLDFLKVYWSQRTGILTIRKVCTSRFQIMYFFCQKVISDREYDENKTYYWKTSCLSNVEILEKSIFEIGRSSKFSRANFACWIEWCTQNWRNWKCPRFYWFISVALARIVLKP